MVGSRRAAAGVRARLLVLAGALEACTSDGLGMPGGAPDEGDVDVVGEWAYFSGTTAAGPLDPPGQQLPTLLIDDDGAGGHTGCNSYGADVEDGGRELSFGPIGQTLLTNAQAEPDGPRRQLVYRR
jgi:hypothetical protein